MQYILYLLYTKYMVYRTIGLQKPLNANASKLLHFHNKIRY